VHAAEAAALLAPWLVAAALGASESGSEASEVRDTACEREGNPRTLDSASSSSASSSPASSSSSWFSFESPLQACFSRGSSDCDACVGRKVWASKEQSPPEAVAGGREADLPRNDTKSGLFPTADPPDVTSDADAEGNDADATPRTVRSANVAEAVSAPQALPTRWEEPDCAPTRLAGLVADVTGRASSW
jgi:hypothetical protein